MNASKRLRCWLSAFTLIEMLTVIAIIGILAGILIPVTQVVIRKARIASAEGAIQNISLQLTAYKMDFGAYPPDQVPWDTANNRPASWPMPRTLSPNQCMVWFLTRQYSTSSAAAGAPWSAGDWNPAVCDTVFARTAGGKYLDVPRKYMAVDAAGYSEYRDPWGRPYLYRTSLITWPIASVHQDGSETVYELNAGSPGLSLTGTVGKVRISGCADNANNGTFDFTGGVPNPSAPPYSGMTAAQRGNCVRMRKNGSNAGAGGTATFLLHNSEGCDLYSLGPNGRTRACNSPATEWRPTTAGDTGWTAVWGTPGDGGDLEVNGNIVIDERQRDDIANWK